MPHLTGFIIDNFRVFSSETQFKFAPINILTGTNSSGKSSILKAIMLFKENFIGDSFPGSLAFNHETHKLGSVDFVLNNPNNKNITIGMPFKLPGAILENPKSKEEDWQIVLQYGSGVNSGSSNPYLKKIAIREKNSGIKLLDLKFDIASLDYPYELDLMSQIMSAQVNINLIHKINKLYIIDFVKEVKNGITTFSGMSQSGRLIFSQTYAVNSMEGYYSDLFEPADLEKPKRLTNIGTEHLYFEQKPWRVSKHLLLKYKKESDLFPDLTNEEVSIIKKIEQQAFKNLSDGVSSYKGNVEYIESLTMEYDPFGFYHYPNTISSWEEEVGTNEMISVRKFDKANLSSNFCRIGEFYSPQIFEFFFYEVLYLLKASSISDSIFLNWEIYTQKNYLNIREKIVPEEIIAIQDTIDSLLKTIQTKVCSSVKGVSYIPSSRVSQSRIYNNNNTSNTLANLAGRIQSMNLSPDGYEYKFLNFWLKELELGDGIRIEIIEGTSSVIKINKNGKDFNLIDQGFGVAQIVSVMLEIVLIAQKSTDEFEGQLFSNKPPVIVEEPEANLHPRLQSKLAEMFIDAVDKFKIQFLIETHSEYFIRKFQYLTAKKIITPNDTVIYYFHDPLKVPLAEQQVKKIQILEDGSLSQDFGTGFFDEALNWKFELLKLKNKN